MRLRRHIEIELWRRACGAALVVLVLIGSNPKVARADCACPDSRPKDLPGCTCYIPGGQWPPVAGYIGSVPAAAATSIGARTSCYRHRGLPYWQIQKQFWTSADATAFALTYPAEVDAPPGLAWCTETVTYWHWAAQRPYAFGYWTPWSPTTFINGTQELREWYQAEDALGAEGRGRWIDGRELDYANFDPGINGPCPGAYQQLEGWEGDAWVGASYSHSQLVDSMVVHRLNAIDGPVVAVDVHLIEGNVGRINSADCGGGTFTATKVDNSSWYFDVIDYTVLGDKSLSTSRTLKIRGWGIDLRSDGGTLCEEGRIRTEVTHTLRLYSAPAPPDTSGASRVAQLLAYRAATQGGVTVTSNSPRVNTGGAWPSQTVSWTIPSGSHPVSQIFIDVDLRAQHPYPVEGITILWKNGKIPPSFQLWWAGADAQIHMKTVTAATGAPPLPVSNIPHFVRFAPNSNYPVRYARLVIPGPIVPQTYEIAGFYYNFYGEQEIDVFEAALPSPTDTERVPAPAALALEQNSPNPFNPTTILSFALPRPGRARLTLHDVRGRHIATLVDAMQDAGNHSVTWNGRDSRGARLVSGVYFARLEFEGEIQSRKITLAK